MSKIYDLYLKLLDTKSTLSNESSTVKKGYVRLRSMLDHDIFMLFRLADFKDSVEIDGIGEVKFTIDKSTKFHKYIAYLPKYNTYAIVGDVTQFKDIEDLKEKTPRVAQKMIEASEAANKQPLPYDSIITKDTIAKIKKLYSLFSRDEQKAIVTISSNDGIVELIGSSKAIYPKEKFDLPTFGTINAEIFSDVRDEIYIKDGKWSSIGREIKTPYVDVANTKFSIVRTLVEIPITNEVRSLLDVVSSAADKNSPKLELNGVLIHIEKGKARAVATDTRRLSVSREFEAKGEDGEYIIQKSNVGNGVTNITIGKNALNDTIVYSDISEYAIYAKEIYGRYPDYNRVIPPFRTNKATFSANEMSKLIKGEKEIVLEVFEDRIEAYKINEDEIILNGKKYETSDKGALIGKISTKSKIEQRGMIAINAKYLMDTFKGCDDVEMGFEFDDKGNSKSVKITCDGNITMIMPFNLATKEDRQQQHQEKHARETQREVDRQIYEAEQKEKERQKQIEEEGIAFIFLNSIKDPKRRGQAKKTLLSQVRYEGKIFDKKDFVKKLIDDGYKPYKKQWNEYSKKLGKNVDKESWVLEHDEGKFIDITKTEAQFAQFLVNPTTTLDSVSIEVNDILENSEYLNSKISIKEMVEKLSKVSKDEYMSLHKIERLNILNRLFQLSDGCEYWSDEGSRDDYSYRCQKHGIEALHVPEHRVFSFIIEKVSPFDVSTDSIEDIFDGLNIMIKESIMTPNEKIEIGGLSITIESKAGQYRRGIDHNGKEWATVLKDDYGFFNITTGNDLDEIDVFINSECPKDEIDSLKAYYIKQNHADGTFDEHKFVLGAKSMSEAEDIYYRNYEDGYTNTGDWFEIDFIRLKGRLEKLSKGHREGKVND